MSHHLESLGDAGSEDAHPEEDEEGGSEADGGLDPQAVLGHRVTGGEHALRALLLSLSSSCTNIFLVFSKYFSSIYVSYFSMPSFLVNIHLIFSNLRMIFQPISSTQMSPMAPMPRNWDGI